jgi:zinc protease
VFIRSLVSRVGGAAAAIALAAMSAPALAAPAATAAPAVSGWGIKLTDVTPDAEIRYGTLPNGMKYAIMRNATPKGTASVRLQFAFGSIGESEEERGLAHFIEHMAFNGTTHVPEGEMIKMLQRQGLAFGPDTNAFTGFDTTTYVLELPQADAQHVDTAMFLFREVASEVKFDQNAIDHERGVILGEERQRDSYQLHQAVHLLGFEFPKAPYANRLPIGLDAVIKNASSNSLRNLYQRYYRPETATLVFVGDADPAEIEAKIVKAFADWKPVGPVGAPLARGQVDLARPAQYSAFADPAVPTSVNYAVMRPWKDPADTMAERRHDMLQAIALRLFNRRLQKLAETSGSSILGGSMSAEEERDAALVTSLGVVAKDGAWRDALATAEQEIRRAMQYGFTPAEFRTEITNVLGGIHTAAEEADTRPNSALANAILSVTGRERFVVSPKVMEPQFAAMVKSATLPEVDAAFREVWTGSAPLINVNTKQEVTTQQIAAAFDASRTVALAAPKDNAAQAFAYDSFGAPGAAVEDKRIADLDVRTVRFANNVRLNLKKTSFEQGRVRFLVRLGDGLLDLPKNEPGLASLMTMTSTAGGLKKHSLEELRDLLAGKIISVGALVVDDAFVSTGVTTPEDLALQMKVSAAYLLDPGFRAEAASQWANFLPVLEKQFDAQPEAVASVRLPILLANGDERFGVPTEAVLSKRNFDEAKAALAPIIASAPIEITIVGDFDEDAAIKAVAASFGALPTRKLKDSIGADVRKATFRPDRKPILLTHEGPQDKAIVDSVWPTTDDSNFRKVIGMQLLKDVLNIMLTESVREKLGDSYGVDVGSDMSNIFKGFGYLSAAAVVAPAKADEVQRAIEQAAAELRNKPISDDLMARARNPEIERADKALRDNGYWLGALSKAQSDPGKLDRIRQRKAVLQSITPTDLQKLARKYLRPNRVQQVRIISSKLATTAAR